MNRLRSQLFIAFYLEQFAYTSVISLMTVVNYAAEVRQGMYLRLKTCLIDLGRTGKSGPPFFGDGWEQFLLQTILSLALNKRCMI